MKMKTGDGEDNCDEYDGSVKKRLIKTMVKMRARAEIEYNNDSDEDGENIIKFALCINSHYKKSLSKVNWCFPLAKSDMDRVTVHARYS